jgi:tetratricopeptide (TPR) repeat protein
MHALRRLSCSSRPKANLNISPRTAAGELPRLFELDPLRFQEMCRDLLQVEAGFVTVEVYGTPGQLQRGIDTLADMAGAKGSSVGQCKCVEPASFDAALIREAVSEFLKYKKYWKPRGVKKFILFVASDASSTKVLEMNRRQKKRLAKAGFSYELWSAAKITHKLRSQPGITRSYLEEPWATILCGTGINGLSSGSYLISSLLQSQLETLAGHVATSAEKEVESLREAWRSGRRAEAIAGLARCHEATRWSAFPAQLKATILRFEAHLALEFADIPKAKRLAAEAGQLHPEANNRLLSMIARAEGQRETAIGFVEAAEDTEGILLFAALLMEEGQTDRALGLLEPALSLPESYRLRALGFLIKRDLVQASLEIQKARELAPSWNAIIYTGAVIDYFTAISPAVPLQGIPQLPAPLDWSFIKTDDISRAHVRSAAAAFTTLEGQKEVDSENRRTLEAWHLACLANDPDQRDAAADYCQSVLARDSGNYRLLAWALARKLEVNTKPALAVLAALIASGSASPDEIIVAIVGHLERRDYPAAKRLIEDSEPIFLKHDAATLWRSWRLQVDVASGESSSSEVPPDDPDSPEIKTLHLRAQARTTGNWDDLISELSLRSEGGDYRSTFELCMILATLKRWKEAEPLAREMVRSVQTAEAVRLACGILYNAQSLMACLEILDQYRSVFPRSEIPTELIRLRIAAQRGLGLLHLAVPAAEDVLKLDPSRSNFLALENLYLEKGDFASLVLLAKRHEKFEDLTSMDLLRLAYRVSDENKTIASNLWSRATSKAVPDSEVTAAIEIGYRLGLDKYLRPLIERLTSLSTGVEAYVRRMNIDQARDAIISRQNAMQETYRLYRTGDVPIHLASRQLGRPLSFWYHRLPLNNESSDNSGSGGALVRNGWRAGPSLKLSSDDTVHLHADLTALLTAAHFDLLDKVETSFGPITLAHGTLVALAAMREASHSIQPARRASLKEVDALIHAGKIDVFQYSSADLEAASEDSASDPRASRMYRKALTLGWLVGDFGPPLDRHGLPAEGQPHNQRLIFRSPHCIVESLQALGEISGETTANALVALGLEHHSPIERKIDEGASIVCGAGILEWLAAGGALEAAANVFDLHLDTAEVEAFIKSPLAGFDQADADTTWLTLLIERLTKGIETDVYRLLPIFYDLGDSQDHSADSPEATCLMDLCRFPPSPGDLLWIDDRCLNGFVNRDGTRIVDTVDIMYLLRARGVVTDAELYQLMHRYREADVRFLAIDKDEIAHWISRSQILEGCVVESRELRTLRRHYASSLADGEILRIRQSAPDTSVEWAFVLSSGAAVVDSILDVWGASIPVGIALARADWIFQNLYVPDRGRGFTTVAHSAANDMQVEAGVLAGFLLSGLTTLESNAPGRNARREYLDWIYTRLIRHRFDADSHLSKMTLDILKMSLAQTALDLMRQSSAHASATAVMVKRWLDDMPDRLRETLGADAEFFAKFGVTVYPMVQVGPHKVKPEVFWQSAVATINSGAPVTLEIGPQHLIVTTTAGPTGTRLMVEDTASAMHYVLADLPLGILSISTAEREAVIRAISSQFDLFQKTCDDAIARIAQLNDPNARMAEIVRLKSQSAAFLYSDLFQKIRAQELIATPDFLFQDPTIIARHLRLTRLSEVQSPDDRLDAAAATLLEEVGVEQTVVRLCGIPKPMPSAVLLRIGQMSPEDRRDLLKRLIKVIGPSPIGAAHLTKLFVHFRADRSSYIRYAKGNLKKIAEAADGIPLAAWRKLLKFVERELWYTEGFRTLADDVRLFVAWTHADRLFRILTHAGVDAKWIRDYFGDGAIRLPAEVVSGDGDYVRDLAHPDRIDKWTLTLAMIAYASEKGGHIEPDMIALLSQRSQTEAGKLISLVLDARLAPDAMNSLIRVEGDASWLAILTLPLVELITASRSSSALGEITRTVRFGEGDVGWVTLQAVLRDFPIPKELESGIREALLDLDLVALNDKNPDAKLLALTFAAQHAGQLGSDVVDGFRAKLLVLTENYAEKERQGPAPDDRAAGGLVSAAFYLYSRGQTDGRYIAIAKLLHELMLRWPTLTSSCRIMIDRLVEGLPNADSRTLWKLQVQLRSIA